jgi:hypothetical protein
VHDRLKDHSIARVRFRDAVRGNFTHKTCIDMLRRQTAPIRSQAGSVNRSGADIQPNSSVTSTTDVARRQHVLHMECRSVLRLAPATIIARRRRDIRICRPFPHPGVVGVVRKCVRRRRLAEGMHAEAVRIEIDAGRRPVASRPSARICGRCCGKWRRNRDAFRVFLYDCSVLHWPEAGSL